MPMRPTPLPPHPAALEEEIDLQHRDFQRIMAENGHVVEENVTLRRELAAVKDEIHRLHARTTDLSDRGMKLEVELCDAEPLMVDVGQLRSEFQKLTSLRQDLSSQIQGLTKDTSNIDTVSKFIDLESLSCVTKEEWRQEWHTFKKTSTNLVYSKAHISLKLRYAKRCVIFIYDMAFLDRGFNNTQCKS
uniref:Uncharacterized protein n=1 Tax=Lactuca sativa TaxID=4236 RepID=A0A9R1XJH3_LACSA|nr:hypothetical protein LSAT_V11C300154630 [Lactuca sativa]